ncbi:MAG: heat-inducible transcriptional repressor HrcA [Betaproteobacteria bacterium]|nr:heat-inducible transcriptional repressor HrcA [Betaproteobacteria bacterium]
MMNERSRILLKSLIEKHISDGQPIGSRELAKSSGLELSPASIRNIMADLEEMGFIASPHTSSGRIPAPLGYRFFVDSLLTVQPLDSIERHKIEDQFRPDSANRLIATASQLLSNLTQFAGVVKSPSRQSSSFRHIEFVSLSDHRILLIIVAPDGDVQNKVLEASRKFTDSELTEATNYLNQKYAGMAFENIRARIQSELTELKDNISQLMSLAVSAGQENSAKTEDYIVSGETNLLSVNDLTMNIESLRTLFEMFDKKTGILQLLDTSDRANGVQIYIGGESGLVPLNECSVVTAPYDVDGQVVGTVGVIGPTRMAYERVIPIVDITAKLLSGALSHP